MRQLLTLLIVACWLAAAVHAQVTDDGAASGFRSSVTAMGIGTVILEPSVVRVSVPIRATAESEWDAIEALRESRRRIEQRIEEILSDNTLRPLDSDESGEP